MSDLRLAIRSLRATPVVSAVATLSLALGTGANTAIFSLVDSLILRTLPVVEPQRLAIISDTRAVNGGFTAGWTYAVWNQIQKRAKPFDGVCAWMNDRFNLAQPPAGSPLIAHRALTRQRCSGTAREKLQIAECKLLIH
jgi:putative ABC transport system permease protein